MSVLLRLLEILKSVGSWLEHLPAMVKAGVPSLGGITAIILTINEFGTIVAPVILKQVLLPPVFTGVTIAAIPFVDVSDAGAAKEISRGVPIAINTALHNVRRVKVLAGGSAFHLNAESADPIGPGKEAGLTHLIEGYVQRVSNGYQVSADLVELGNNTRLWSSIFPLENCDVPAPHCDQAAKQNALAATITRAVAAALKVPIPDPGTDSEEFRMADDLVATRKDQLKPAIALLTKNVASSWEGFLPAWELLAYAFRLRIVYDEALRHGNQDSAIETVRRGTCGIQPEEQRLPQLSEETDPLLGAKLAAERAIWLNPQSALGHAMLAAVFAQCGDWPGAVNQGRIAFGLDPADPRILHDFSQILTIVGYLREALDQRERLRTLEPNAVVYNLVTADILAINGRRSEAIHILESLPNQGAQNYFRNVFLARLYAATNRYQLSVDALRQITEPQVEPELVRQAASMLQNRASLRHPSPAAADLLKNELNFVYLYTGAPPDVILAANFGYVGKNTMSVPGMRAMWLPELHAVRQTDTFRKLIRDARIEAYWRQYGWPDLCRPKGPYDFVCD